VPGEGEAFFKKFLPPSAKCNSPISQVTDIGQVPPKSLLTFQKIGVSLSTRTSIPCCITKSKQRNDILEGNHHKQNHQQYKTDKMYQSFYIGIYRFSSQHFYNLKQ